MAVKETPRSRFSGIAVLGYVAIAAGCQNGGGATDLAPPAAEPKVTQSELLAFCPPVGLREGTAFFTTYGGAPPSKARPAGDVDPTLDAEAAPAKPIRYQTSITDVTRSCTRAGGQITMTIAVAGKVVPGPAGATGTLTLPIRIAVANGPEVLFSQLYRYDAQVASATSASTFLFTASDVTFPDSGLRSVRAFAGFDEGPPKQAD